MKAFSDAYIEQLQEGGTVLDLGAHKGKWSEYFHQLGFRVFAADRIVRPDELSPDIEWETVDLKNALPALEPDSLDGIFIKNVIQFLKEERVAEIIPVLITALRPGGTIGIETFYDPPEPSFEGLESFYTVDQMITLFDSLDIVFRQQSKVTSPDMRGIVRTFFLTQVIAKKPRS